MKTRTKFLIGLGVYFALVILLLVVFGNAGKNDAFKPQDEFKLEPWIPIKIGGIDLSINRFVFYVVLASALTIWVMVWISRRMQDTPNRVLTAVEAASDLTRNNIVGTSLEGELAIKWFPFVATLFFFIWFSNVIGYLPLPTNSQETINILGIDFPAFGIYAATANISMPLALTLVVWISYNVEGIRSKGFIPYFRSWLPAGLEEMNPIGKAAIFMIEVVSHFVRLVSLSVRLFANVLAGHLLLLFMGGGLAVLLGLAALGALTFPMAFAFFIFELGLIATLQAFIFSILTAIYIGGATAESH
jgi:F-type H+-transporting ATPase subunit a